MPTPLTDIIDVHTHHVPHGWPDLRPSCGPHALWLKVESERDAVIMAGSEEFRRITAECWDAQTRLADMDADAVSAQVVSPTPVFFHYGYDGKVAARVARIFNDAALKLTAAAPDRLIPFAQVPLQDIDEACREVDRCIANGHRGVEIGNHVGDKDLDDGGIVTFLQHCATSGVPVFVHPWDMPESPRLSRWMARWLTSMPAETHLSLVAMILGGAFDRVDSSLRICFAHGGGSFPYWLGRLENAWHRRRDLIATSARPPSHYVDRFYVDSVVFDPRALRLLIDTMGTERVLIGSDYPYPLGERPVGEVVRRSDFLDPEAARAIGHDNAQRFLYG